MVVTLIVGIYVARYLGPLRFGLLSYAISFTGLFIALATLGLDGIMVRELVRTPERKDELIGTAFWLKIGGAFLMWSGIVAAIPFTENNTQTNILIAIIAFGIIFQAFKVIDLNYQAEVKSKFVVLAQIIQLVVSSAIKLVLISLSASLIWFAWVILIETIVLTIGLIAIYLLSGNKILSWKWRWKIARQLLGDSWPLILSGMVISIYMKIDQVMIKEMLNAEQVGIYAAAVRLSEAWYFIPTAIISSIFPAIINAKKQAEKIYNERLQKLYALMLWMGVAIALPTTLMASWIIRVLYGDAFAPASEVLSIHIWSGVFVFLGFVNGRWIIVENLQYIATIKNISGAVVNIVLNIVLIPKYGINGAAMATLFSVLVANHIVFLFINKARNIFTIQNKSFLKPILWIVGK